MNTVTDFKNELREMVAKNELSQVFQILKSTLIDDSYQNQLISLQSQHNRLLDLDYSNLVHFKDIDLMSNNIVRSLLHIIDSITEHVYNKNIQGAERELLLKRIGILENRVKELNAHVKNSVGFIDGKRLFQYRGYYPIDIQPDTNIPSLNQEMFIKAIRYFLKEEVYDRLAASDIVYLRKDNLDSEFDILGDVSENIGLYNELVDKYDLHELLANFKRENETVLGNYIRLINEIGDTLQGVHMEILLHNVRNPLRSVIAAKNTTYISGRKLFDPSTRFVVEYVKHQGKHLIKAFEGDGKVGYIKEFKNGRKVKATTTPIFHHRYGLVAIVCINIDIEKIQTLDPKEQAAFFEKYCQLFTQSNESELLKKLM